MPTMSITMTFMSENVYFPLYLWSFYCSIVVEEGNTAEGQVIRTDKGGHMIGRQPGFAANRAGRENP